MLGFTFFIGQHCPFEYWITMLKRFQRSKGKDKQEAGDKIVHPDSFLEISAWMLKTSLMIAFYQALFPKK